MVYMYVHFEKPRGSTMWTNTTHAWCIWHREADFVSITTILLPPPLSLHKYANFILAAQPWLRSGTAAVQIESRGCPLALPGTMWGTTLSAASWAQWITCAQSSVLYTTTVMWHLVSHVAVLLPHNCLAEHTPNNSVIQNIQHFKITTGVN